MSDRDTVVVSKEPCPLCQEAGDDSKGDNLNTFESGVKYCFRHGTLGKSTVENVVVQTPEPKVPSQFETGEYRAIKSRGLSRNTCKFYGYMVNVQKRQHIANYYDASGAVVMQQIRTADKKFPIYGNKDYNTTLWGAHLFTSPNPNCFITITEGQLDALSIAEAFDCKYPVVSLPNGAKAAPDIIEKNKKYLDGFKYIVLAFDNDKDGREATEACLKILEPGQARVVKFPQKDANDMIKSGDIRGLQKLIYNAVEYIPAPVLTGDDWLDTLKDYYRNTRQWPWKSANKVIAPLSIPGVYSIAASPGVGKTVVVADIMKSAIAHTGKVGVISLEESSQVLLLKLADMLNGTDLSSVTNRSLTDEEIEMCRRATQNVVTYDHKRYGSKLETILENLPYIAQSLKCDTVVFDNLSYSATDEGDDERRSIDKAMIRLKDSTSKYTYALINVCHLNSDHDDFRTATIRGSRAVMMYSDYVIHLGRDIESDDPDTRNLLTFYVKKDRLRGMDAGKSFQLRYDPIHRKFIGE